MITAKTIILAPIWGFGLMAVGVLTATNGSDIETRMFPVLTDQRVSNIVRVADRVCWDWTYIKRRSVTFVKNAYFAERDDGIRFPVAQFRPDLGIPTNDSTTARRGIERTIPECVTMPATLAAEKHVTIHGTNFYQSPTRLWLLVQDVKPVDVDMLPSD